MGNFQNITVVSIDGRPGECLGAQYAIHKSARELVGAKQLLISAEKPKTLLNGICHQKIQPLNYFEYTIFVLYSLYQFIDTEYALIVQEDGWVLNGRNWRKNFFDYDYLGAPIHLARVKHQDRIEYLDGFQWTQMIGRAGIEIQFVQNGGFSLRSKKFLEAFTKFKLPYELPTPNIYVDELGVGRFDWGRAAPQNEDVYCCIDKRVELENLGIRFAPLDVCKYFSYEHFGAGLHEKVNLAEVLGHHSKLRRIKRDDSRDLQYVVSEEVAASIYGESEIINALRGQGIKLDFL